jgi:hypothetical protein
MGLAVRRLSNAATMHAAERIEGPFVWTFDGALADCRGDLEDTLRRAIVQVRDVASIVVLIELSLPALKRRVDAGESLQPAWAELMQRLSDRHGLPSPPRVRPLKSRGPLVTLVVAYRS